MGKPSIVNLIESLPELAQKNKWIKTYDKELDYFSWNKVDLSKDIREIKISKEVLLYFNQKGIIEGFGVEYLKNGFIQHNPRYKNLTNVFTEKTSEGTFTISPKQEKKVAKDFQMLVKDLTRDIYQENWGKRTPEDFEKLLSVAIR